MKLRHFILGVFSGFVAFRLVGRSQAPTAALNEPRELVKEALHVPDLPDTSVKHAFENALHPMA
jgi:hypothetical protein